MNWKAQITFVESDPTWKELEQAAADLREQVTAQDNQVHKLLYKLQRLLYVRDLVMQKVFDYEVVSEDHNDLLEKMTANDSECWHSMLTSGVDDLQTLICDICQTVAVARMDLEKLQESSRQAGSKCSDRAAELRGEWIKQQRAQQQEGTDV